jgi:SSS family solute:Na+ symporter
MSDINSHLQSTDYIVVIVYLIILIVIGYLISFSKKRNTEENLFLAGRSLRWSSIGLNMWGTNVGPSMLIASASIGYTTGVVAGNFGWYAFVFIFLLAVVFAPRYIGAKVQTLPEFMGKRFGNKTRNILAWYSIITILISWLGLTLFAGSIFVCQILNVPMWVAAVILIIISAFFTIAGGLKAVAYTNVFQMALLIIVSFIITIVGLYKVGGIAQLYHNTPSHYWNLFQPLSDKNYPWLAIILGYPIMGVWFWCTDQSMVQSVLGARNLKQGQLGAYFTGWLKILDVALFIIPGIICFILFPNLKNPDSAYMTMVTNLLPNGFIGLVMAVIMAALISTIDSALNSLSTVFTMDIYIKKYKSSASQSEIIKIGRIVTAIGALIALLLTLAIDSIKGLKLFDVFQAILGFIAPPMSVVFLFGILWKKTTTRAANFVLSAGTLFSLGIGVLYLWVFPSEKFTFWPHFLLLSFYIFVILSLFTVIISYFDNKQDNINMLQFSSIPKTDKSVYLLWAILIIVMIGLYILFNGH